MSQNTVMEVHLLGESAMVGFGKLLSRTGVNDLTLFLEGNLGMGKTTLSRGILQGFGHTGAVKSPTYTLVEPYQLPEQLIYHFDLYRLGDPEELEYLGIRDYFAQQAIRLIEWPEKGQGLLPCADMTIDIARDGEGRCLNIQAATEKGRQTLTTLSELFHAVDDRN